MRYQVYTTVWQEVHCWGGEWRHLSWWKRRPRVSVPVRKMRLQQSKAWSIAGRHKKGVQSTVAMALSLEHTGQGSECLMWQSPNVLSSRAKTVCIFQRHVMRFSRNAESLDFYRRNLSCEDPHCWLWLHFQKKLMYLCFITINSVRDSVWPSTVQFLKNQHTVRPDPSFVLLSSCEESNGHTLFMKNAVDTFKWNSWCILVCSFCCCWKFLFNLWWNQSNFGLRRKQGTAVTDITQTSAAPFRCAGRGTFSFSAKRPGDARCR